MSHILFLYIEDNVIRIKYFSYLFRTFCKSGNIFVGFCVLDELFLCLSKYLVLYLTAFKEYPFFACRFSA